MSDNLIQDRHYIGSFTLDNEKLGGEIIYSRSAGNIALHLEKRLVGVSDMGITTQLKEY